MKRREFIAALGGAAAWPVVARAQQPSVPVIGLLSSSSLEKTSSSKSNPFLARFHEGLSEIGYIEGRNVAIEYRWAEEHYDRLPALAAELAQRQVKVIVAANGGLASASAAKAATTTISIVFMIPSDPVKLGLVSSFSHPGGNLTGVAYYNVEVAPKRLELLHKLVPTATSVALLVNPANSTDAESQSKEMEVATRAFGLRLLVLNASNSSEIEAAFDSLIRERVDALQLGVDGVFGTNRDQIVALAARYEVPTIYPWREFTAAGGLMNYGTNIPDVFREVGVYTGKILKGEKPADLPVWRPTEVRFVINVKTANALGLTVPASLLALADEVIE